MYSQHDGLKAASMSLTIDHRERKIRDILANDGDLTFAVADLPVGDALCEYDGAPDKTWIMERKTTQDLSQSIKSGRWREQQTRLSEFGKRVVFIIEGDIRKSTLPCDSLWSAIVNVTMRSKSFAVYRTWDVFETASLLKMLQSKMKNWSSGMPFGSGLMTSKRKRDADDRTCHIRMLACLPSISEGVATALVDHFGSLPALQRALESDAPFPKIFVGKTSIGKARIEKLRKYLCVAH